MTPAPATEGTIAALLAERAGALGDRTLVVLPDEDGRRLTYAAVHDDARRLAWALLGLGLRPGDRVAIALPNGADAVVAWFACLLGGLVDTAVAPDLHRTALEHALGKVGAAAVLCDRDHLDGVLAAAPAAHVVCRDAPEVSAWRHDWATTTAAATPCELSPAPVGELASIRFTSGSTGLPKGIMMSQAHMRASARMFGVITGFGDSDVVYSPFPLHHVLASITGLLAALEAGGTLALARRFSARRFWPHVREAGATVAHALDPVVAILLKAPERPDDAEHPVRKLYTAAGRFDGFEERFGTEIVRLFDMSELTTVAWQRPDEERREGSCGRASGLFDVGVADEAGRLLPAGEVGELVVRPTRPGVMFLGYYGDDQQTVAQWRDLWFHTGDMARRDAGGYLFFVGRSADRIRHRGVNVSPAQIEAAAEEDPDVAECAAVGVPAELGDDDVKLCLRLVAGTDATDAEIGERLAARLPEHGRPRYVQRYEALPRTDTGKLRKGALRAEGLTERTWDVDRRERVGPRPGSAGAPPR